MNRHIYRFIAAVLAAMTIVSCNDARKSETYRLLEDVDSYIEARPDSALAMLEKWYFSIVDIVSVLTESVDATAYWRKLKQRLKAEGNESVTNCHALKMPAADGKMRMTDVADQEQMFRLIQSIPSPKAEHIKRWIAQVASELEFTFDNWFRTLGVLYAALT